MISTTVKMLQNLNTTTTYSNKNKLSLHFPLPDGIPTLATTRLNLAQKLHSCTKLVQMKSSAL